MGVTGKTCAGAWRFARAATGRARHFDMHFAEILKDQVGMAQRIYAHFGMPMSDEARQRMRAFIAGNPRDRHGTHRYTLEQFGLDRETERARYRFYQDYFKVAEE